MNAHAEPNVSDHFPFDRQRQLSQFFHDMEIQIHARLRSEASSPAGREELLRETGIDDPELLDELGKLGVTADGLIALRLFPLVLVAWAERGADESERTAVLNHATRLGIAEDTTAWILLQRWLERCPDGLGLDAWRRYTRGLFASMSPVARNRLIKITERQMVEVAKASGGYLGWGTINPAEQETIDQILKTMRRVSQSLRL